jgi:hypothetical protein
LKELAGTTGLEPAASAVTGQWLNTAINAPVGHDPDYGRKNLHNQWLFSSVVKLTNDAPQFCLAMNPPTEVT